MDDGAAVDSPRPALGSASGTASGSKQAIHDQEPRNVGSGVSKGEKEDEDDEDGEQDPFEAIDDILTMESR